MLFKGERPKVRISDKALDKMKISKEKILKIYLKTLHEHTRNLNLKNGHFKKNFLLIQKYKNKLIVNTFFKVLFY